MVTMDWLIHSLFVCWVFTCFGTLKDSESNSPGSEHFNSRILDLFDQLRLNTSWLESKNLGWYSVAVLMQSFYSVYSITNTLLKHKRFRWFNVGYNAFIIVINLVLLLNIFKILEFLGGQVTNVIIFCPVVQGLIILISFSNYKEYLAMFGEYFRSVNVSSLHSGMRNILIVLLFYRGFTLIVKLVFGNKIRIGVDRMDDYF